MTTIKNNKERKNTLSKKNNHGGRVFARGGYGCVFRPPLKCKNIQNTDQNQNVNNVTKLMMKKYAKREVSEFEKFKKILKNIPNYKNYFLINNITLCIPEELSKEDLKNFDKNCKTLEKNNYNESNINEKLDDLLGINMPYGGIEVSDYVDKTNFNIQKMKVINNKLIHLLKNGIIKMNEYNIYHGDIKETNVLVGKSNNDIRTRLIDWGMSVIYNGKKNIPILLSGRPIQYNVPFSSILLNNHFKQLCDDFLRENPNPSKSDIRSLILYVINNSKTPQLKLINYIFKVLYKDEYDGLLNKNNDKNNNKSKYILEYNYTIEKIYNYLSKVLEKYIKNGTFHQFEFFKEVYLKNVDIWGFFSIYLYFVEYISIKNTKSDITNLKKSQLKLIDKIKEGYSLILNSANIPINIDALVTILKEIDPLLNESLNEEIQNKKNSFINLFQSLNSRKISNYKTPSGKIIALNDDIANNYNIINIDNINRIIAKNNTKKNTMKNSTKKNSTKKNSTKQIKH
jgi:hypothetical protein